ncbi:response regulator [Herbaspirillum sp. meg3]|jgi:DNA-binding NarL/FixJ family response regulator|uniref:response regulator n=1 Tax=Herbaspirillum sp. meg3 TaxID=2025949 RepID=UPI000B983820|nr:response regulator [Herbaspirillum sp. meg3]ASU40034.1 response regulator [Herbaspirillum sp. meg3]
MEHVLQDMSERMGRTANAPLKVFLVEDSADVRDLIMESLAEIPGVELAGYAETEQDAAAHLENESYDVLILDIQLKQGNGMNLLQSLARSGKKSHDELKIIFSNHVSATYRRVGLQYGVQFFFDKSSEFTKLRSLIERLSGKGNGLAPSPRYTSA